MITSLLFNFFCFLILVSFHPTFRGWSWCSMNGGRMGKLWEAVGESSTSLVTCTSSRLICIVFTNLGIILKVMQMIVLNIYIHLYPEYPYFFCTFEKYHYLM